VDLDAFQQLMADTYGARDATRGRAATIAWLAEEVGELAQAVRKGDRAAQAHELGDVLAWLASLASQLDIPLGEAVSRYTDVPGCPVCRQQPCSCPA
jgi:NTP pyrophosphatase (non-canonical NTP hydrolase)